MARMSSRYRGDDRPHTPAIIDKVRADLPVGFSEKVADRIPGGLLSAAQALDRMAPTCKSASAPASHARHSKLLS